MNWKKYHVASQANADRRFLIHSSRTQTQMVKKLLPDINPVEFSLDHNPHNYLMQSYETASTIQEAIHYCAEFIKKKLLYPDQIKDKSLILFMEVDDFMHWTSHSK